MEIKNSFAGQSVELYKMGWQEYATADGGKPYYVNSETGWGELIY